MSSSNMHDLTYFISDCQHNIILPYSGYRYIYICSHSMGVHRFPSVMESLQLEPTLPPIDGGRAAWSYLIAATLLEASILSYR